MGDLIGFLYIANDGLNNSEEIILKINKYLESFFLLHLPKDKENLEAFEDIKPEDNYEKFINAALKLVLSFSELWKVDPFSIAQNYTIRQLQGFAKILNSERKPNSTDTPKKNESYKCYTDQWGAKVEEWEEEI